MAKRLTDTEKWNDDWFLSLSNDYRIIWQWLLDTCNHAGICKKNIYLLNLICNTKITEAEFDEIMKDRVLTVGNKWFIPKFLKFQYTDLGSERPVIQSVLKELEKHNLIPIIIESFGNDFLIIKDKRKRKDKDSLEGGMEETFKSKQNKNGNEDHNRRNFKASGENVLAGRVAAGIAELNGHREENYSSEING